MKQQTLTGFEKYGKTTRRAKFLADMDRIIPWPEMTAAVETVYPKISEAGGRPPIPLERMLRIYFLQLWFNLSDPAVEEALYDSVAMRSFVGIDLGVEGAPDETTVCKFRHLLERAQARQDAAQGGQRSPATQRYQDLQRHHRGCDDYRGAQLDQEQGRGARPGDASDGQGQAVVLRHEGAHRRGQQDQADPHDPGLGGERARTGCTAAPAARRRRACWGDQGYHGAERP